jgi:exonuclease VII small subunit
MIKEKVVDVLTQKKLGLEDKVKIYERNIESAREYKKKLEEMLKR